MQQQQHPYQYGGQAAPPASLAQPLSAYPPSSMERNLGWPGETASLGPRASTMELLHGPQLMSMNMSMGGIGDESGDYGEGDAGAMLQQHELDEREGHSGKAPRQKRNRSALSCAECRRLKLKCSREPWPCSSCVKRKCAHICPEEVLKEIRPSRTKEVGALHERIRELEYYLAQATAQSELSASSSANLAEPSSSYQPQGYQQAFGSGQQQYGSKASKEEEHPGVADVAEVMGTLLLGDDGSSRYLGKSAANALFHDAGSDDEDGAGLSDGSDEDDGADAASLRLGSSSFPMSSRNLEVEDFQVMLPPISESRRLAEAYYTNCAYMFEPLKREVFEKHLRDAYDFGADPPLPLEQLALVFMVLALGVSFDLSADMKDVRSPKYHSIAQACLTSARFLNVPSLASIQCLHLMSTWQLTCHSQTGAFRAWPLLGLAGRMVLSTGIHRDGSIWAIPEPHLTIRRWLFWEIVSYDRLQSLILGRPYMLNSKHWDTIMPEPPMNECIEGKSLEFQRAKWSFAMIVGDLCDDCLSVGRPAYETILLHDRKIRNFKATLPQWLRFDSTTDRTAPKPSELGIDEQRQLYQRHTMTVMINETMLFLHRVAFANAIEHYSAEPLRSPWAQSVVSLCLEASRTLIAVARSAYAHYPKLAARWWHIQCHTFGAGVCFAAVCIKSPASALTRLAWNELNDAVLLLENVSKEGGHARDLYPRLRKLRDQALVKLEHYQNNPVPPSSTVAGSGQPGNFNAGRAAPADMYDYPLTAPSAIAPATFGHALDSAGDGHGGTGEGTTVTVKEEEAELAVLGAATRKLEGNFVQRHQPTRTHSAAGMHHSHPHHLHGRARELEREARTHERERERDSATSSLSARSREQSAYHSAPPTALPSLEGASSAPPSRPLSGTASTFHFADLPTAGAAGQQPVRAEVPLSHASAAAPSPLSSTYSTTYENLDPGLADMLASISGNLPNTGSNLDGAAARNEAGAGLSGFGGAAAIFGSSPLVPDEQRSDPMDGTSISYNALRNGHTSSVSSFSAAVPSSQAQSLYSTDNSRRSSVILDPNTLTGAVADASGGEMVFAMAGRPAPVQQQQQQQQLQHQQQQQPGAMHQRAGPGPLGITASLRQQAELASFPPNSLQSLLGTAKSGSGDDGDSLSPPVSATSLHFSSPGHEYFERHPSVTAGDAFAAAAVPLGDQQASRQPLIGRGRGQAQQQQQQIGVGAVPAFAPPPASVIAPARAGGEDNDYLDTAWMDYFPTPGVGLYQQTNTIPPPSATLAQSGPPAAFAAPYPAQQSSAYAQQQQEDYLRDQRQQQQAAHALGPYGQPEQQQQQPGYSSKSGMQQYGQPQRAPGAAYASPNASSHTLQQLQQRQQQYEQTLRSAQQQQQQHRAGQCAAYIPGQGGGYVAGGGTGQNRFYGPTGSAPVSALSLEQQQQHAMLREARENGGYRGYGN